MSKKLEPSLMPIVIHKNATLKQRGVITVQPSESHNCACLYQIDFYRASICEGGLGSRNSVRLYVRPSVCHTGGL